MSAYFARPEANPHRRGWSPRTVDLDADSAHGTCDLGGDNTSDLFCIRTQDVVPHGTEPVAAQQAHPPDETARAPQLIETQEVGQDAAPESQPAKSATRRATDEAVAESREPQAAPLQSGSILNERYLIERQLGSGGTARVFRARDLHQIDKSSPRARVALKIPHTAVKDRSRATARLQHEFRHARSLTHPNIVQVFELAGDEQTCFMTMELIEGKSLAALMSEPYALSEQDKRAILRSCAEALSYAHEREIVHGDFKPANVLVSHAGQVKVFDFGAAYAASGEDTRIAAGTPPYASPQVLSGMKPDPRDDIFSFAVVAYQLLTGEHPFEMMSSLEAKNQGKTPARAWSLSAAEWLILLSSLSWEREQRPARIDALIDVLVPKNTVVAKPEAAPAPSAATDPEPPLEPTKEVESFTRGWGFFAFLAVVSAVMYFAVKHGGDDRLLPSSEASLENVAEARQTVPEPDEPLIMAAPAAAEISLGAARHLTGSVRNPGFSNEQLLPESAPVSDDARPVIAAPPKNRAPAASVVAFSSSAIETSEGAISAVFVVERTGSLAGRSIVHWKIENGSAHAGEDFISAESGTIEFLDGQSRRAIYIPLRDDLEREGDETFSIVLTSAQRARLGETTRIEATIRDDD